MAGCALLKLVPELLWSCKDGYAELEEELVALLAPLLEASAREAAIALARSSSSLRCVLLLLLLLLLAGAGVADLVPVSFCSASEK
jgi:hypothetical protein